MLEDKVEFARDRFGEIFIVLNKYKRGQYGEICVQLGDFNKKNFIHEEWESDLKIGDLIDIIKEGDYINGCKVIKIKKVLNENIDRVIVLDSYEESIDEFPFEIYKNEIKSIVTKEQMKQIEYRVKE